MRLRNPFRRRWLGPRLTHEQAERAVGLTERKPKGDPDFDFLHGGRWCELGYMTDDRPSFAMANPSTAVDWERVVDMTDRFPEAAARGYQSWGYYVDRPEPVEVDWGEPTPRSLLAMQEAFAESVRQVAAVAAIPAWEVDPYSVPQRWTARLIDLDPHLDPEPVADPVLDAHEALWRDWTRTFLLEGDQAGAMRALAVADTVLTTHRSNR